MMKLSGIWQTKGWRRADRLVRNRMLWIEIQIQLQNVDARLVSQARHLRQIAHRGLWHIGLPERPASLSHIPSSASPLSRRRRIAGRSAAQWAARADRGKFSPVRTREP